MARLVVIANRLPLTVSRQGNHLEFRGSTGGLATGLSAFAKSDKCLWIGWPGIASESLSAEEREEIRTRLRNDHCRPVFLSQADVDQFYLGFSNRTLWPLFHGFTQFAEFDQAWWSAYLRVNRAFRDEALRVAEPGDVFWIHDYQLMLLPQLLRDRLPRAAIGFFLHIPFPAYEIFRILPWRCEILQGLMGADLVGFHIDDYVVHYLETVRRLIGLEPHQGRVTVGDRFIEVHAFPMSIDVEKFSGAAQRLEVQREIEQLPDYLQERQLILSVDRLDYTKGIPERLRAFDRFLEKYPEFKEKATFIQVAVPTREEVGSYQALKKEVENLVSRINGSHGTLDWQPVRYYYRTLSFPRLAALYAVADTALVTPLRDGMNLIAKEFVATRAGGTGVLILSEMAGAAKELVEALQVNPHHVDEMADAIYRALTMPTSEQIRRNRAMLRRMERYPVTAWAGEFVATLRQSAERRFEQRSRLLTGPHRRRIVAAYRGSNRRLILLDYDGTLVAFFERPNQANPDPELYHLLDKLVEDDRNEVVLVSGRDAATLEDWFPDERIRLVAEHGVWVREQTGEWIRISYPRKDWKQEIRSILDRYAANTPGAFIEEKPFSIAWHYRAAEPQLGRRHAYELQSILSQWVSSFDIDILHGKQVIELRDRSVNKGNAVARWLARSHWDFILAVGDDVTDEDMFRVLPSSAYSIKVGKGPTEALYALAGSQSVRSLLAELLNLRHEGRSSMEPGHRRVSGDGELPVRPYA